MVAVDFMAEAAVANGQFGPPEKRSTENAMTGEMKVPLKSVQGKRGAAFAAFAVVVVALWFVPRSVAQQQGQRTFRSADEASLALFNAAQQENEGTLLDILGPAGKEIISSGDPAEDINDRVGFVVKYKEMHRFAKEPDGTTMLYVGAENWPFPIPLVNKNGTWFFDTDAGKEEVLVRRIGNNELEAMDACRQLVDAEKKYYQEPYNGQEHYSQRFVSDKGKHNGLFWSEASDQFDSAIDPLIASAGQEEVKPTGTPDDPVLFSAKPIPFNGYYFRILTGQGKDAPGGAKSYIVNGQMVGGFAFIAYPAEYRSSGVMTFMVSDNGVIYEKDLGPNTTTIATSMNDYNPDSTWHKVD
jgi:Protein of unknown function (DUF2950)